MKKTVSVVVFVFSVLILPDLAFAQYRKDGEQENEQSRTRAQMILEMADSSETPVTITLQQALEIALSENVSVKIADKEIERTGFAKKGTYASLFPQVDVSGAYQRTIKKQVMYMDFDMGSMGGSSEGDTSGEGTSGDGTATGGSSLPSTANGLEVGRWNTWSAGVTAAMPLVNLQLWKSIKISGMDVELAVEKARSSRLDMVTQVKQAYYSTLLAKEAFEVYKEVYENAVRNYEETEKKYNARKATELDLTRAKTTVANAVPDVYNAESSVILSLWQLKAVLGVDLDENLDVAGKLADFSEHMFYDIHQHDSISLENNTTMKQLAIQAEQLAETIKMQKYAYVPTLAATFNFSMNAMTNDFNFSEYRWTPYSYVVEVADFGFRTSAQDFHQTESEYHGNEHEKLLCSPGGCRLCAERL